LPEETEMLLRAQALKVFDALMLEVYARMDFIVDGDGRVWCLEANTLPGLTPASLMPKEAAAAGLSYTDFCALILSESLKKYE
ncbi:MAG: D-alanine--D-alanine ligase, partial [Oscillospiraceae bacterium]|nr:D-alanine--D-alanine ligase [Oscillospiraceae bacterium]